MFRLSLNRWIMDLWRKLLEKQNCIKNKMKLELKFRWKITRWKNMESLMSIKWDICKFIFVDYVLVNIFLIRIF